MKTMSASNFTGLRKAFHERQPLLTTFSIIPSLELIDLIGAAGFDGVILDMEHSSYERSSIAGALLAARARGMRAIVRVPDGTASTIQAVLDLGADGVLAPQIESAEAAKEIVAAARYAPEGRRGVNPWVRSADYAGGPEYFEAANHSVGVLVMVESAQSLEHLSAILEVDGLDGIFIGPADLSSSLGHPGNPTHPDVVEAMNSAIEKGLSAGRMVGAFAATPERAHELQRRGVSLVGLSEDTNIIYRSYTALLEAARTSKS